MERAIFDGRRYLGLTSFQTLSLTPREFTIEMMAQVEATYDEYERQATYAMWARQAANAKRLKSTDLFKRPRHGEKTEKEVEDIKAKQAETMAWLSQFEEFSGKE